MVEISRAHYRHLYGPTTGDTVRLADTDLVIEVERDLCAGGDEAVFGGGKVIRESMGQSGRTRAEGTPDLVVTGALILDHWGVVKADVGVRDGRIVGIGKAGNPDTMTGVDAALVIGPSTEILAGNGRILTAGAIDCHVHLICPQIVDEALASGVTTLIGGGTGPAEGTKATTVTAGAWNLARMHPAMDRMPVNVVLLGKGNTVSHEGLWEQVLGGAGGFKLHEDWGTTPAAIDACLTVADESGVQVAIHTDTLNEAGYVESTLAAIGGRSIHTYHTEGAGGGHAPDIITVAAHPNVLPSSTNPTRPHTVNTLAEHLDMLMVCHHLNSAVPEDLDFAESRIRPSTIAAEDVLHDMGAISIIGSDGHLRLTRDAMIDATTDIEVGPDARGHTVVRRMRCEVPMLVRVTDGRDPMLALAMVNGAAGPLGGDRLRVRLELQPGSQVSVRSVAAAMAQPGPRGDRSELVVDLVVGDGATLDWHPEPTVSVVGSDHRTVVRLAAAGSATVTMREAVSLGRHGEPPGRIALRQRVTIDGVAVLDHETVFAPGMLLGPGAQGSGRTVTSEVVIGPVLPEPGADVDDGRVRATFHLSPRCALVTTSD